MILYSTICSALISISATLTGNARIDFHANMKTEDGLYKIIEYQSFPNSAASSAYQGLAKTMMAQYAYLPNTKLSYFNAGKRLIENAIAKDKNNAELRYIRLMVQLNIPSFLSYSSSINQDIDFIHQNLSRQVGSSYWRKTFILNLKQCESITKEHIKKLESIK